MQQSNPLHWYPGRMSQRIRGKPEAVEGGSSDDYGPEAIDEYWDRPTRVDDPQRPVAGVHYCPYCDRVEVTREGLREHIDAKHLQEILDRVGRSPTEDTEDDYGPEAIDPYWERSRGETRR